MQLCGLHRLVWMVALSITALGCGGSAGAREQGASTAPGSNGGDARAASSSGDPAVDKCLSVAGAKRTAKPDEPPKITVKHVLVKYAAAKRAAATVARSREQACLRAEEARAKLEAGTSFSEIVRTYSEEPGAASRDGSIGEMQRTSHLAPPFADAAFELKAGEVSHVVETDFGFHIILRTE